MSLTKNRASLNVLLFSIRLPICLLTRRIPLHISITPLPPLLIRLRRRPLPHTMTHHLHLRIKPHPRRTRTQPHRHTIFCRSIHTPLQQHSSDPLPLMLRRNSNHVRRPVLIRLWILLLMPKIPDHCLKLMYCTKWKRCSVPEARRCEDLPAPVTKFLDFGPVVVFSFDGGRDGAAFPSGVA